MKPFSVGSGIASLYQNRDLLRSLVGRELQAKYRATTLGFLWVVIYPLMMLAVYSFVFGVIFGSRWRGQGDIWEFVEMLYCGLIVHALFSETVSKAPGIIVNNPNYVKKVVFPLELLPVGNLLTSLFNSLIGFGLLLVFVLAERLCINWTAIFAPLVLIPIMLYAIGFAWFLAALGVFFRDIEQFIGILMSMLLFLSPVFYATSAAPEFAQKLMIFNPLTYGIEEMRNVLLNGEVLRLMPWGINLAVSSITAWCGLWVFERSRPAFADVI
ncbi:ABC transporter permease [Methylomonas methanica]|uniref:Transport permease protein n=1 Tax=Methylomonas methanica TaxID=421 RepID=A0A177MP47_METMH|nr:ABC transporter permease [Methylomonas methanica]OAI07093.1 hypothetical protein A1332_09460 [Methylomonas methanica]